MLGVSLGGRGFSRAIGPTAAGLLVWLAMGVGVGEANARTEQASRAGRGAAVGARDKAAAKPAPGPLIAVVSLARQRVSIYGSEGLLAQSAVSTGQAGHRTPTGVFSVIQKNRYHRSNIYSGAPMPYMQRITWSGVALHAGVIPGLSRLARLHPPAASFRRRAVGHDQDGRARDRRARRCGRRRARQSAPASAHIDASSRRHAGRPGQAGAGLDGSRRTANRGRGCCPGCRAAPSQPAGAGTRCQDPDLRRGARHRQVGQGCHRAVGRQGWRKPTRRLPACATPSWLWPRPRAGWTPP